MRMGKDKRTSKDHVERTEQRGGGEETSSGDKNVIGEARRELSRKTMMGRERDVFLVRYSVPSIFCHLNYRRESQGQKGPSCL